MEALLQSVVSTAARYYNNRNDPNALATLENKLEALIAATQNSSACAEIDVDHPPTSECLSYLVGCLASTDLPPQNTISRLLTLFFNLAIANVSVRQYLQNTLQLGACLTTYYTVLTSRDREGAAHTPLLQCLRLLQVVTYQTDCCAASSIQDLVTLLIAQVQRSENELTQYALAILTNVCTQSMAVRDYVRRLDNVRALYKLLLAFLESRNLAVVITALSLICRLSDELREKTFSGRNMSQTFQCMFNVLIKGDQLMARHYASDLFKHILNYHLMDQVLASYEHFGPTLVQVSALLVRLEQPNEQLLKVYELLFAMCNRELLRRAVCAAILQSQPVDARRTPLLGVIDCVRFEFEECTLVELPLLALRLFTVVIAELIGTSQRVGQFVASEVLVQLLDRGLRTTIETGSKLVRPKCERIVRCLQLVQVLTLDRALTDDVQEVVSATLCAHLVEFQMISNPVGVAPGACVARPASTPLDWWPFGVDVVLDVLQVLETLRKVSRPHAELHMRLLKDSRLVPFLAFAITSDNKERVGKALRLMLQCASTTEFQPQWLADIIASNINSLSMYARSRPVDSTMTKSTSSSAVATASNGHGTHPPLNGFGDAQAPLRPFFSSASATSLGAVGVLDNERLDELIASFKSGLKIRDPTVSQLMEVYERKLLALEAKERQLQDLLQSKNASLQNTDRILAQYRSQRQEVDYEASKLRAMLLELKLQGEQSSGQVKSLQQEKEKAEGEIHRFATLLELRDKELDRWKDVEAEHKLSIQSLKAALDASKKEIENEKELHMVLRKHYDSMKHNFDETSSKLLRADEEVKQLKKHLKEKEQELMKQCEQTMRLEATFAAKEDECRSLERSIEKLQQQMQTGEHDRKTLQKQLAEQESQLQRKQAVIKQYEAKIEGMQNDLQKYTELRSVIHKLTTD